MNHGSVWDTLNGAIVDQEPPSMIQNPKQLIRTRLLVNAKREFEAAKRVWEDVTREMKDAKASLERCV